MKAFYQLQSMMLILRIWDKSESMLLRTEGLDLTYKRVLGFFWSIIPKAEMSTPGTSRSGHLSIR